MVAQGLSLESEGENFSFLNARRGKKTGFWLQNEGTLERAPIIGLDTNIRLCTECLDLGCVELKSKDLGFGVSSVSKVRRDR